MQDELPIRDTWPYEDRPSSWQRTEMRRRTDRADLIASEGSAGAVIARLRARARTARKSSLVFLAGLIATVAFGLAYYLLLPFWENWVDNREATLNATLTEIEDEVRKLEIRRDALIASDGTGDREPSPGLPLLLRHQFERIEVPGPRTAPIRGTAPAPGGGLLIYGPGRLLRLPEDGGPPQPLVESGVERFSFRGTAATPDGALLVYGDNGALLRLPEDGSEPELMPVKVPQGHDFLGTAQTPGGGLLIYGRDGPLIRLPEDGGPPEKIEVPGSQYRQLTRTTPAPGGGLLIYGRDGPLLHLREDRDPPELREVTGTEGMSINGTAPAPGGGLLIYGPGRLLRLPEDGGPPKSVPVPGRQDVDFSGTAPAPGGGLLIFSTNGTLLRLPEDGGVPEVLEVAGVEDLIFLDTVAAPGGGLLVYGDSSMLVLLPEDGSAPEFLEVTGAEGSFLFGTAAAPGGGLLLYGDDSTLVRLSKDGGAPELLNVVGAGRATLDGSTPAPGGGLLVYGSQSTLLHLPEDGGVPELLGVPATERENISGTAEAPDGALLLYGGFGMLIRTTNKWSEAAQALQLEAGLVGDRQLATFLDSTLPAHLRDWPPIVGIRDELADIMIQREAFRILDTRTEGLIDELDELPYAGWRREQLRLDLLTFLATCRGDDGTDAALTEACLDAWQERQASAEGWWRTLAEQVPPGILILFLLATLGGLYRYNLRLAGFHDSRADALELLAQGRSDAELRDILAKTPGEAVDLASVFLAADKVEMGAIKAKLGAAELELAKSLSKR